MQKYYFTGKPCRIGHISKRFISNRWCYECALSNTRKRNKSLKEETKFRKTQTLRVKARAEGNHKFEGKPCGRCLQTIRYVSDNRCVQCTAIKNKLWQQQNKKRRCFSQSMREANKLKATPSWSNIEAIKKIYLNCPKNYTVDHIIPLQGREVCGLHVEYNLQYLTAVENSKKSNKLL